MQSAHDVGGSIVGKAEIPVDNIDVLCMYGDLCQTTYDNFFPDDPPNFDPRTNEERRWKLTPAKLLGPQWRAYSPDMNNGVHKDKDHAYCTVPDKSLARSLNYQVVDDDSDVYYITATSGWPGGPVQQHSFLYALFHPLTALRRWLGRRWFRTWFENKAKNENSVDRSNWIGYVGVSEPKDKKRDLVVAWRGTQAISEWETDITASLMDWGVREDQVVGKEKTPRRREMYQVHKGFNLLYRAFDETPGSTLSVQGQVQCAVRKLLAKYPGEIKTITTTGHSLGGAMASISAFDLWSSEPIPIRACTFEAPMVGNQLYADAFNRKDIPELSMVRVVNKGDLVPEVPRGTGILADLSTVYWIYLWFKFNRVPPVKDLPGEYHHGGVLMEVDASKYADKWNIWGMENHQLPLVLHCLDPSRPYYGTPKTGAKQA